MEIHFRGFVTTIKINNKVWNNQIHIIEIKRRCAANGGQLVSKTRAISNDRVQFLTPPQPGRMPGQQGMTVNHNH